MNAALEKVRSRAHWVVRVHPARFEVGRRLSFQQLEQAIRQSVVSLRGWDYPHIDPHSDIGRGDGCIGQSGDWYHHVGVWRAFPSGQCVAVNGVTGDWRDQSPLWPLASGERAMVDLSVLDAVFRFVEIYEFAARWARAALIDDQITVHSSLRGIKGRFLTLPSHRAPFFESKTCDVDAWRFSSTYPLEQLLAETRALAVAPTIGLFAQFKWDINAEMVSGMQRELGR